MPQPHRTALTGGRLLARNVLWNLAGQLLPLPVAILAAPFLVRGLGLERFGVLSLAWTLIGYFSLFDLGMGRALTKLVADRFAENRNEPIGAIAWTTLALLLALGGVGTLVMWALTPWLVRDGLRITEALQTEALWSFYLIAAGIPLLTVTSGLRGLLEAGQHFTAVTLIRVPMSLLMFLGPLAVLPFSQSLVPVVLTLVAMRLAAAVIHLIVSLRTFPSLRSGLVFDRALLAPVLRLGGWMTVTNVVGPVMAHLDRFLVGALVSMSAVAYYTAPYDVITRFLVMPMAAVGVLFPAFASSHAADRDRATLLLARGTKYVFLTILPILLIAVAFASDFLLLWLGPAFSQNSTAPLRWLAIGVLANGVAQVPFAFLQAAGRPDLTAKLHAAELPFYLGGLWALTASFGITGTAMAWSVRSIVDAIALFALVCRTLPNVRQFVLKLAWASAGSAVLFLGAMLPMGGVWAKALVLTLTLTLIGLAAWRTFSVEERTFVLSATAGLR
jgi:O-antigen/teichoic acid export membrane protein